MPRNDLETDSFAPLSPITSYAGCLGPASDPGESVTEELTKAQTACSEVGMAMRLACRNELRLRFGFRTLAPGRSRW